MVEVRFVSDLLPLAAGGPEPFTRAVGGWVLVGQVPDSTGDWSYRTGAVRTIRAVRAPTGEIEAMIDPAWNAFVLRKRDRHAAFASTVLIGRASTNDVVLPHTSVSKLHARLRLAPEGLSLSDAGSSNGTIVNGDPLRSNEEVRLESGDLLRFGSVVLQVFEPARLCGILQRLNDG